VVVTFEVLVGRVIVEPDELVVRRRQIQFHVVVALGREVVGAGQVSGDGSIPEFVGGEDCRLLVIGLLLLVVGGHHD